MLLPTLPARAAPAAPGRGPLRLVAAVLVPLLAGAAVVEARRPPPAAEEVERSDRAPEYRLKAAFLHHFVRYTTWPAEAFAGEDSPIELLLVGLDPFREVIDETFRGKRIHGRRVVVRRRSEPPATLQAHLVFLCDVPAEAMARVIEACAERPVLLVGDESGFAERGGHTSFFLDERRVRFEINVGAARASRLGMSSELLKLARIVETVER